MEYRPLGRTGLEVSVICLGTMTFGEQNSEAEGHAQIDHALDRGVNFLDTAEMYAVPTRVETYGRTEEIIGSWFARGGRRDEVILATKVVGPGPRFPYIRAGTQKLDRANITQALEDSLRRLRTDYVDLYQLHWPDRPVNMFGQLGYEHDPEADDGTPIEETLSVLADLIQAGKVRHVGLSNETPWGVMRFLDAAERMGLPRMASIQNAYNLVNRVFEVGLAEVAIREQCGLLAYAPMGAGSLSGKYLDGARPVGARGTLFDGYISRYQTENAEPAIAAYVDIARRHGLDPGQMANGFVLSRPFLTSAIVGATTLEQLKANIDCWQMALPEAVLREIEEVHVRLPNPCP